MASIIKNTSSHDVIQLASHVPPQEEHRHECDSQENCMNSTHFLAKKKTTSFSMTYQLANTVGISSIGDFHDAGKKMSNGCVQYRYNHVQSLNQLKPPSLIAPRHKQTLPM